MAHSIQDQLLELSILLFIIGSALEKLLGCVIVLVKWQSVSAYRLKCIFIKQITVKVLPNSFCQILFFKNWVFKVFITKNYINTCTTHYFCIRFISTKKYDFVFSYVNMYPFNCNHRITINGII